MNIEEEIRIFLSNLCKDLGICDPLYDLEAFVSKDRYEVNEFIRQVFIAEGLDPDLDMKLFRQVKRRFTDRFGSEIRQNTVFAMALCLVNNLLP